MASALEPDASPLARAPRAALVVVALVVAALTLGCGAGAEPRPPAAGRLSEPPPIVLVTIDTLRRDHLGCYGYFRNTSPSIDALARESVVFDRAVAAMSTTLPSHLSIFTGLYPFQHGFTGNRLAASGPYEPVAGRRTVAQMLSESGYTTAAFVSGRTVNQITGVQSGFSVYDDSGEFDRAGAATSELALSWMRAHANERFFTWIHYWDCHEPNEPPPPYASMFPSDERLEQLIDERKIDPELLAKTSSKFYLKRLFFPTLLDDTGRMQKGKEMPPVDRAAVRDMLNRYDGSVRYVDDLIGRLVSELRRFGIWDRAIVVITADHGQSLGQHGWLDHGQLTDDNLLAPLLIHFPPGLVTQPLRVETTVSLIDVMPTVLARFDSAATRELAQQAEGKDALSGDYERAHVLAQRSTADRKTRGAARYALFSDQWKLVVREEGKVELYDLAADPGELSDVRATHPEVALELERSLAAVLVRRPAADLGERGPESPEFLETLRQLGYTGDSDEH